MAVFYAHPFSYQAEEPLLNQSEDPREESPQKSLTIPQVFAVIGLRKPLMIVSLVMVTQQLSGKYHSISSLKPTHSQMTHRNQRR